MLFLPWTSQLLHVVHFSPVATGSVCQLLLDSQVTGQHCCSTDTQSHPEHHNKSAVVSLTFSLEDKAQLQEHLQDCTTLGVPIALTQERQVSLSNLSTGLCYTSLVKQRYNYRYRDLGVRFKEGYVSKKVCFKN